MTTKPKQMQYSLRWSAELHELAQKAAVIKGHETLKSYLAELVECDAKKTLEEYQTIKLSNKDFDKLVKAHRQK